MGEPVTSTAFAAIRRSVETGQETIDPDTIDLAELLTIKKAREYDEYLPGFAEDFPVVRYAKIKIIEEA